MKTNIKIRYLCLLIAVLVFVSSCGGTAEKTPQETGGAVMKTENFEVTDDVFQYYMNLNITSFYNSNTLYMDYLDLDITKPLKEQICTSANGEEFTWFDYFASQTKQSVGEELIMAEYAKSEGISLDADDENQIEDNISSLRESAEQAGRPFDEYLRANLGSLIGENTVREVYKLHILAQKARDALNALFVYGDAELEKYCEDNYSDFYTAEYMKLDFSAGEEYENANDEEKNELYNRLYSLAVEFNNSVSDRESFEKGAEKYYRSVYTVSDDEKGDGIISEYELSSMVNECYVKRGYSYMDSTDALLFSSDRVSGEHFVTEDKDVGVITVYFILEPVNRKEEASVDIRHIFLSEQKHADKMVDDISEIFSKWYEMGGDEASFAALAGANSEDATATEGGLVKGAIRSDMSEQIAKWCFAPERNTGDTTTVEADGGVHIIYFISRADCAWKEAARYAMSEKAYDEKIAELSEKYTVGANDSLIKNIPDTVK